MCKAYEDWIAEERKDASEDKENAMIKAMRKNGVPEDKIFDILESTKEIESIEVSESR